MHEEIADLIESHLTEIAQNAASEAIARRLPGYAAIPLAQLAQLYVPAISMFVDYLRKGDASQYRDYVRQVAEVRIAQGIPSDEILIMTEVLGEKIKEFVNGKLPGETHARERAGLERRVSGIVTVAYSTITATQAAHRIRSGEH